MSTIFLSSFCIKKHADLIVRNAPHFQRNIGLLRLLMRTIIQIKSFC